ncbi:MAG: M23 family metallopeptidase [Candidatus Cloacimonetes bacterium]|nr:M23 family metallopeptidase [Candidatus Cloacimonadota bacterium]MBL7086519.1 M23 family metallopeptidase [Candidatus Cloacimonadota bacterium]
MKKEKYWHILVTSNSSTGVKNIHFSKTGAYLILTFVGLLLITTGIMTYLFFSNELDHQKLRRLQEHNIKLKNEMARIHSLLDTMQINLKNLQDKDNDIRQLEGMRSIDIDIRQMGVGGFTFIDSTFYSFDRELFDLHNDLINKISIFNRQLNFEIISYDEILRFLTVKNTIFRHTPSIRPAKGRISDGYGYRIHPITNTRHFHHGVDIANKIGSLIYATADGKVIEKGYDKYYGRYILIDHGYGYKTFFAHLRKEYVEKGNIITRYQIIAEMGNSGFSTGSHLHYEVRFYNKSTNPVNYFNKKKSTIFVDRKYLS